MIIEEGAMRVVILESAIGTDKVVVEWRQAGMDGTARIGTSGSGSGSGSECECECECECVSDVSRQRHRLCTALCGGVAHA